MKKALLLLMLAAVSSTSFAQSGRRTVAAPAPSPTPAATEDDKNYSESVERRRRPDSPATLRGGGTNSGGERTTAPKTAQTPAPQTQTAPEVQPTTSAPSAANDGTVVEDNEVLNVETALVTIPVSVFDRNGRYIPALQKGDFKIFENGVEQEVAIFNATEKPFTVILLIDTSPSTQYKIDEIQAAAISFVNQLQPLDRVMVIEFDSKVHVLSEPTSDRNQLARAIKRADFGDGTALYDAVDDTLGKRISKIEGRKAVVLFTDGVDTTSFKAGYDGTLRAAEEADALVFPVYYDTFRDGITGGNQGGVMSSPFPPFPLPGSGGRIPGGGRGGIGGGQGGGSRRDYTRGKIYLEELAERTGGRLYDTNQTRAGLETAFASIAEELRRQYSIGYYPSEVGQPGDRKKIKVRVAMPNVVIRARDSYIVGETDKPQTTATAPKKFDRLTTND